jgi:hypothetical protein
MSCCGFLKPDTLTKLIASRSTSIGIATARKQNLGGFGHDAWPSFLEILALVSSDASAALAAHQEDFRPGLLTSMDVYVSYGLGLSQLVILGDVTRLLIYSFGSTCSRNSSTVRTGLDARLAPARPATMGTRVSWMSSAPVIDEHTVRRLQRLGIGGREKQRAVRA